MTKPHRVSRRGRKLTVIGKLGVLVEAAERSLVDVLDAIPRLQQTTFYVSPKVLEPLLQRYSKKPQGGSHGH